MSLKNFVMPKICTIFVLSIKDRTMARTIDKDSAYRVRIHRNNGYCYASAQPIVVDPDRKLGRNKHVRLHWGTVDEDLKFHPNNRYLMASPQERARLIFPEGWDLSEAKSLPSERGAGRPAVNEDSNLLYGDIWFMEQVSEKVGLRADLLKAFGGNVEKVDAIMSIAMYQVSNGGSFNRIHHWQQIEKAPSAIPLTAPFITSLTQSISEENRMDMFRLRAARVGDGDLCALDSTTQTAWGGSLADIMYGRNKEHLPLPVTTEVVVYDLDTHMPIYYRSFPGNIPDSRTIETILKDLRDAGFPNIILITDRGYESIRNLERYILDGQKIIAWIKVRQNLVTDRIREFGSFTHAPESMTVDAERHIYYRQYGLDYKIDVRSGCTKSSDRLKMNLYFDPVRRGQELMELDIEIKRQRSALEEYMAEGAPMDDDVTVRKCFRYYELGIDDSDRKLKGFSLNQKKVDDVRLTSGFFANITHGIDYTAIQASEAYSLRDEQEKYFEQRKGPVGNDRQRCWSEDGKNGRMFINFAAMIMASYIKHIWKSTDLKKQFCSFTDMIDEMRPIRCIEHKGHARHITPFVGKQFDICKAFGFEVPEGCDAKYKPKKTREKKVGRPKKARPVAEPKG